MKPPMLRDPARLAASSFDVVIIGAGIYGAAIARDAAQRGLSVAVIDRGDIGGGTSFNSLKTVHGGIRSLQRGALREMRLFVRERRALIRLAPHLVHPLPFLIPTWRHPLRNRALMRAFFAAYDFISRDRNDTPDRARHLPDSRILSREACLRRHPLIEAGGVTGGAQWYDCQMYSVDRLTLAFLQSAVRDGAVAANYVEARALLVSDGRAAGLAAHDRLSGRDLEIRARLVINAAGPWAGALLERLAPTRGLRLPLGLSKAMNIVTPRLADDVALGGVAGSRFLFAVPWREYSILGTSHAPHEGGPDALEVTGPELDRFLAEVRQAFPRAALGRPDVRLVHRGLLPAAAGTGRRVRLLKESLIRDHARDGLSGLVTVVGVRYTTARATAEQATNAAFRALGSPPPPCRTAVTTLAGGDIADIEALLREARDRREPRLAETDVRRLVFSYGSKYAAVLAGAAAPDLEPLGAGCAVTRAEIRHAVRAEMAVRLADAVLRRTEAGSAGHPGADALERAASVMAGELGWPPERIREEIADVERFYQLPSLPS
jgi:glycerol-3-phosphate dehydrogenase